MYLVSSRDIAIGEVNPSLSVPILLAKYFCWSLRRGTPQFVSAVAAAAGPHQLLFCWCCPRILIFFHVAPGSRLTTVVASAPLVPVLVDDCVGDATAADGIAMTPAAASAEATRM